MKLPTVRVRSGDSFVVINESDFDPELHEIWEAPDAPESAQSGSTETTPEGGAAEETGTAVVRRGSWYFGVDAEGEKLTKGFRSEEAAQDALAAVLVGD